MRYCLLQFVLILSLALDGFSQGSFFGSLQFNSDFYVHDEKVVDPGLPPYDNLKSASDGWLNLDYVNDRFGFDLGIRMDLFLNSSLHNPSYLQACSSFQGQRQFHPSIPGPMFG